MNDSTDHPDASSAAVAFAHLRVMTNFTFLTGASHPDELVGRAVALGCQAVAVTDTNSLAGIVRAHVAAKAAGLQLIVGCRLRFTDPGEPGVLVYPTDHDSYGRLCRLLTLGKRRAAKGACDLSLHDLFDHSEGLLAVVLPPVHLHQDFVATLGGMVRVFDDDRLSLAAEHAHHADDRRRLAQLAALMEHIGLPHALVATHDVQYHLPQRRALHDVLACIRLGCTLDEAGLALAPHGEMDLKSPQEMARWFEDHPQVMVRTMEIANRARSFNLDQLRYEYPDETCPAGTTPMRHLTQLTWRCAADRFPAGVPAKVRGQIEHELRLIEELGYASYFLTVHDLVLFANSRGILCQGRGAAANSAVCYCLGVTSVDPSKIEMLFERFVSRERDEPPDIDVDFEHERREEVIQYLYEKYGRDRAALTAEVIRYRGRSAVREVGKALGLSLDCIDRLSKEIDWWEQGLRDRGLRKLGLNPQDPTMQLLMRLIGEIQGFPRHLSQHVGGFVITRKSLCEYVPIENAAMADRTIIEWDKDDIDAMGMLKVDVLGLGMLTCIRKGFELLSQHHGRELNLATVPADDAAVYDMICHADTVGVFQIESRAQMTMLPRLRPRNYYDLVIEVAIVRPGPIQGQMVHPYLRRRNGQEAVEYPNDAVRQVLGRTLGVPLFQEQVMALSIVAAGFTPGEADQLRRAIAAWKSRDPSHILRFQERLTQGMLERGYPLEFAQRVFDQIKGFGDYGFPESHAASFALLVYVSAWIKHHHPAAFACALLNSQPMGFYAPAQIVRDAQEHGVEVRAIDVAHSDWDCTLESACDAEGGVALRLGMRLVKGLRHAEATAIAAAARRRPVLRAGTEAAIQSTLESLWRESGTRVAALRALARADAFNAMGLDRQAALWQARALRDEHRPLLDWAREEREERKEREAREEPESANLPAVSEVRRVIDDYQNVGLSLRSHPVSFIRDALAARGVIPAAWLRDEARTPAGMSVTVAGMVLVRQRPGTASGIIFITIEDETGIANLIVRPHIYERHRSAARHGILITAKGRIERQGQVVHLLVRSIRDATQQVQDLHAASRNFR